MSQFQVALPPELWAEIARVVRPGPGGAAEWVAEAVREKLAASAELEYLEARAARGSSEAYRRVLGRVAAVDPTPGDERRPVR